MKAINLVCSTAFMMGAALVISLLTNVSGIFPDDVRTYAATLPNSFSQ